MEETEGVGEPAPAASFSKEQGEEKEEGFVPIVKDDLLFALQRFGQSMKDDSAFLSKIACH
jgi:hypothetical protein